MFLNMKGFTFIELIIYITIVSLILILASGFTWNIIQGSTRATSYREVQQNARFAMERIIRVLRAGYDPGVFLASDGILYQNGVPLTADQVEVTNFEIIPISNTYKINLGIKYSNPEGAGEYDAEVDFQSAVCILPGEIPSEGCWGTGGFCDDLCQYFDYGSLTGYYTDPGCSDSCTVLGSFYFSPSGVCSNDGTGSCYKMGPTSTQDLTCSQGTDCETGCGGICTLCEDFDNPTSCTAQLGCFWQGKKCRGDCRSCDAFTDPTSCQNQSGCSWQTIKWYWSISNSQEGYDSYTACEWYSILIVSGTTLLIAISASLFGISESGMGLQKSQSSRAFYLASLCAEDALMKLKVDLKYLGNETLIVDNGSCTILPVKGGGNYNRVVRTTGTIYNQTRKIEINIEQVDPKMIISSWQEVADF
jgi:type II secretory pathway pseudopilin PulG